MTMDELAALKPGDRVRDVLRQKDYELTALPVEVPYENKRVAQDPWIRLEVICASGKPDEIGVQNASFIERIV